jgi:anti-sigma factor RsiW
VEIAVEPQTDYREEMIRYLLGALPDAGRDRLEARYFADPAAHDELVAAEQELIEDYLAGRMAGGLRRRFARRYLSSAPQRRRVRLMAVLADVCLSPRLGYSI